MTKGFLANPSKYDLHVTQQHQQCSRLLLIMEGIQTRFPTCFSTHLRIACVLQLQYKLRAIASDLDIQNLLQQCQQLTWSPVTVVAGQEGWGGGYGLRLQADCTTGLVDPTVALPQSALLPTLQRLLLQWSC